MPDARLPGRGVADEDRFVGEQVDAEPGDLIELVGMALDAGRVGLAARLVGLIPDSIPAVPALERARAAARLLLLRGADAPERAYDGLIEAWIEVRQKRIDSARRRMRRVATDPLASNPHRGGPGRRRR
jgi:hypothetical protein